MLAFSVTKDDCEWQYFRAGGKGGQHQNKTSSGVRVIHHPSGARGESREERSQLQNRKKAWKRMVDDPKFRLWINRQLYSDIEIERKVEEDMKNIKVEIRKDGRWIDVG